MLACLLHRYKLRRSSNLSVLLLQSRIYGRNEGDEGRECDECDEGSHKPHEGDECYEAFKQF